jgi:hypothetical protein
LERPQVSAPATAGPPPQVSSVAPRPVPQQADDDLFPLPESTPPPRPQPQRKPVPNRETPLLEKDVDALLGMKKPGAAFELDDEPTPRQKPVSGVDAFSLMDGESGGLHLTPQKATLLAVAVVVLMGIAFAAGYLIASNT